MYTAVGDSKTKGHGENKRSGTDDHTRTWRAQASALIDMTFVALRDPLYVNPHWKASRKTLMISNGET